MLLRPPRRRVAGVRAWIDGRRVRASMVRGRLAITLPPRRVHVRVVWRSRGGRTLVRRFVAAGCR